MELSFILPSEVPCSAKEMQAYRLEHQMLPHTMFFLMHDIQREEKLFREEVLAILAAMKARLARLDLSPHRIVPVSIQMRSSNDFLLTYLLGPRFFLHGSQQSRILQASYDGNALNVWMSGFLDFKPLESAEQNFRVLQYMAGKPIRNTSEWIALPITELQGLALQ